MTLTEPPHALRLSIDTDALAANWKLLNDLSGPGKAAAAVKADAYGLGIDHVLPTLRRSGASDFFVAHWCEVSAVLAHAPAESIAVLHGPLTSQDADYGRALGVRPVINSLHQAALWIDAGGGPCDLMVDTGINRLGLPMAAIHDPALARLDVVTLLSHLASADEDCGLNLLQLQRFRAACAAIPARRRSLANSAGIALGAEYAFDLTRPGLALYGGVPRGELAGIRQVAFPQAAIMQVRDVSAGETIGYNATFTATGNMRVGVISLGYADGFLRSWGAKGALLYAGALLPLLGKVSMDMVVIDLAAAPHLREGDWVELPYHLPRAAEISGLSQYELLTILGQRFTRS